MRLKECGQIFMCHPVGMLTVLLTNQSSSFAGYCDPVFSTCNDTAMCDDYDNCGRSEGGIYLIFEFSFYLTQSHCFRAISRVLSGNGGGIL